MIQHLLHSDLQNYFKFGYAIQITLVVGKQRKLRRMYGEFAVV